MSDSPVIAIVHYHVRRGGVTRVIQNAVQSLKNSPVRCVVVTGETPPDEFHVDAPIAVVDGLAYKEGGGNTPPQTLVDRAKQAVREVVGSTPDIWHIHNHSLGKNASWSCAVALLAEQGERLLLQIHDFAEDGRPSNYRALVDALDSATSESLAKVLYPHSSLTHYALLNGRDHRIMLDAGALREHTHLLPNAVWTGATDTDERDLRNADRPLYLYPTRAIRRKNVGEFLLWSAMEADDARYGITLAPQSEQEMPYYERWKQFADAQRLPVEFELGANNDFRELVLSATALVTTSIAEGFGLAFLEPWLSGRPLVGRNLPEITSEFLEEGIDLEGVYDRMSIPAEWIDVPAFRAEIARSLTISREVYGRATANNDVQVALNAALCDGRVEYGRLNEALQETVIRRVLESKESRAEVFPSTLFGERDTDTQIRLNKERVQNRFGLDQYRDRLMAIYNGLLAESQAEKARIRGETVLDEFLAPERFSLLRT